MQFPEEVAAIETLRAKYPTAKKMTLAKQIVYRNFTGTDAAADNALALKVSSSRPVLSAYSVIRRYDSKQAKKNATQATQPQAIKKIA